MWHGADISYYQSGIPSGMDFVICRASHGTTTDSKFAGWWRKLAGHPRGAYHFAYTDDSVTAQADHFVATVGTLRDGDVLVLDHETRGSHGPAHDAAWAKAWLERVEARTGVRPAVYTYLAFAEEGRCAGLGGYPLWIADPSRTAGKPRVPAPWKTWAIHQYSSAGGLDRDVLNGSAAAWRALGKTTTPQEDDDVIQRELKPGLAERTELLISDKTHTTVELFADNTYFTSDGAIKAFTPVKVRVAVMRPTGHWQTEHVTVGRGKEDHQPRTKFALADKDSVAVSVTRESGDGTEPVIIAVY